MARFKLQVKLIGERAAYFIGKIAEGVLVKSIVEQIFQLMKIWGLF